MMKRIIYAVMLLLGLSIILSCNKIGEGGNNDSNQLSGTWTVIASKIPGSESPTAAMALADELTYITFKSNGSVQFEDAGGVLETGNYSYMENGKQGNAVLGEISFSNTSLRGGEFERIVSSGQDRISWDDIEGISISIVNGRITF